MITTSQLSDVYKCESRNISDNFKNNESHFTQGVHYYKLDGDDLKEFKSHSENIGLAINKFSSTLYLWTRKGASRHCKMLGTDKAWDMFDRLEDRYFNQQSMYIPKTLPEALRAYADEVESHEETKVKLVEAKTTIEEQRPKVEFADQVASTKDCIDIGTLAKAIRDENISIGRNKLFKWLKDNKYLMENNIAYQDKIDKGLFKTIIVTKNTMYGIKEYPKTLVTGKGQLMLVERLRE